jgi:hypothetical protein
MWDQAPKRSKHSLLTSHTRDESIFLIMIAELNWFTIVGYDFFSTVSAALITLRNIKRIYLNETVFRDKVTT